MELAAVTYRHLFAFFSFFITLSFACSSRTYNENIKDAEKLFFVDNNPYEASKLLIEKVNDENEDQILYMLEAGHLLQAAGKYQASKKVYLLAQRKVDQKLKSVSTEVFSLLSNDRGKTYYGEDHEITLLHSLQTINDLVLSNPEEAFVSIRKGSQFLESLRVAGSPLYEFNAFSKYLSFPALLQSRDAQDAEFTLVEMRQAEKIFPQNLSLNFAHYVTAFMSEEKQEARTIKAKLPANMRQISFDKQGSVTFLAGLGIAPIKVSRGKLLQEPGMQVALRAAIDLAIITQAAEGISVAVAMATLATAEHPIPKYQKRKYEGKKIQLVLSNSEKRYVLKPSLLNNVEETMRKNFERRYHEIRQKMIQRIAAKVVATLVAQKAAEAIAGQFSNDKNTKSFVGLLTGAIVGVTTFSLEKPDLRCWHTVPALLYGGTVFIPPGKYNVTAQVMDANGNILDTKQLNPVTLEAGKSKTLFFRSVI